MKTVSISFLAEQTGESVKTLQNWIDAGILKPEQSTGKSGRGVERAFRVEPLYGELLWALVASGLRKAQLPPSTIKPAIDHLRLIYDPVDRMDRDHPEWERVDKIRAQMEPTGYVFPLVRIVKGDSGGAMVCPAALDELNGVGGPLILVQHKVRDDSDAAGSLDEISENSSGFSNLMSYLERFPYASVVNLAALFAPLRKLDDLAEKRKSWSPLDIWDVKEGAAPPV